MSATLRRAALNCAVGALPTDAARASAAWPLSLAVKSNISVVNHETTAASRILQSFRAPYSATAVERLQSAGFSVHAMTNQDEFGMGSASAYSCYGAAHNPYSAPMALLHGLHMQGGMHNGAQCAVPALLRAINDAWLTPGGSSGGSAAEVAAGLVSAALGSDTGGSVRQPAAFCGVVGLKPSYGRVSRWGLIAYASSLDCIGFLARTVNAAGALLHLAGGEDRRDDTCLRLPRGQLAPEVITAVLRGEASWDGSPQQQSRSLRGVRVGVPVEYLVSELPQVGRATVRQAAEMLQHAGAQVVAVSLPSTLAALSAYYLIASAEAASNLSRYDGVRYGYRAVDASLASDMHSQAAADNAAERLHQLYKRTRHQGFGAEVRRRLMIGNFALSRAARAEFYDAACRVRKAVASDFDAVFRPVQLGPTELAAEAAALDQPVNRFLAQQAVLGSAPTQTGVDVLLTPTSPTPPWLVHDTAQQRPVDMYMHDVMTVPASLARLPALAVPLSLSTYPADALRTFEAAVKAAASNSDVTSAWSPAALHAAAAQASSTVCVPTGVQLLGRYCDERTLLRVGATLESQAAFQPPAYCSLGAA